MSATSPAQPAPATGPRAMAEQDILRIIWPPDGRVPWEDRRKVPEIERTIGHLLDVLETGGNYMEPPMSPEASYRITQKIIDLKASGYTEVQIAEMTGLTKDAVHNRICRYRQKQQTTKAQEAPAGHIIASDQLCDICGKPDETKGGCSEECARENAIIALQGEPIPPAGITATDLPAALRSAAPDQLVEANKMIASADSSEAKPPSSAADHIVEANDMVADIDPAKTNQTIRGTLEILEGHVEPTCIDMGVGRLAENSPDQPKVEQVSGQAALQDARVEQSENSTIQKDRMVEESAKVPPKKGPKIPHSEDEYICSERDSGKVFREICESLVAKGVVCRADDVIYRYNRIKFLKGREEGQDKAHSIQKDDTPAPSTKDVMLLQPANVADTSQAAPKPTEEKPAPKAMTRAETDKKMWNLWKSGKSPKEIADILWDEQLYYSEKSVTIRLRSQGADI